MMFSSPVIIYADAKQRPAIASAIETTVVPQMVDGGLVKSILIITNSDITTTAIYHVSFYGNDGQSLKYSIQGIGSTDHLDGTLAPGASVFLATSGTATIQQQGWATTDSRTSTSVAISQILQVKDPLTGKFDAEALIQGTRSFFTGSLVMPFDNTNGNVSSVAVANTSALDQDMVNVTAVDQNGNTLVTDTISIGANQHTSFILAERWVALRNAQGTLVVTPSTVFATVSLMGLRFASLQNGFTVTTLPVIQQY